MDFSGYRTPVLTERLVRAAAPSVTEIVVPAGTYCTEGARDMLEKRKLTLTFKNPSH
jgi:ethanolamine utilization cobalamin adenosyltransferase